ncbi:MAG: hypothetical protein V3U03_14640, partial [Myxococcota bacterium]
MTRLRAGLNLVAVAASGGAARSRWLPGLVCAAACAGLVALGIDDYGVAWDEGSYFSAADSYVDWLKHPSGRAADRDRAWRVGHEHPPLLKVWMG